MEGIDNIPVPSRTIPVVQEVWIESGSKCDADKNEERENVDTLETLCRICATDRSEMIPIFGEKGKKLKLAKKINKHLPITVSTSDKLPLGICVQCIFKIQVTIELINTCVKAQLQLAEILVSKEKLQNCLLDLQDGRNNDEYNNLADDDNIGIDEMFPNANSDKNISNQSSEDMNSYLTSSDNLTKNVDFANNPDYLQKSLETILLEEEAEALKNKRPKENVVKTVSKDVIKKPKFKVVVVKVKNNGGVPDHKQIAQTLRELKLDIVKNNEKDNSEHPPPKEGHVVILNETVNLTDENTQYSEVNDQAVRIEFDSLDKVSDGSPKAISDAEPHTPPDHSYTHWNQKHEECNYCSEKFVGRINLISHQMTAHPENVFCCFKCDQVFYDCKEEYVKHIEAHCISSTSRAKKVQPVKGNERCATEDEKPSGTDLKVTAVARVSVDQGSVDASALGPKCEQINEARSSGLRMKLSKEFEGMDPDLKNKIVGTIRKLVRRNRFSVTGRNVSCPICKIKFTSATALESHRRIKHDERLPCRFCSRLCRSESALKKHESYYHVKEFKCHVCGEQFKARSALRKHELAHYGDRPYKCTTCGKSYASRGSLQIHATTHSSDKPYLCDKCGKGFKHVSNLNAHKRTHSDDPSVVKAHRCPVCSKAFRCQFLVREHMRMHTGDKPFVCEHCGKSFYKKQQLRQHSAVHSAAPLFKCSVCGARFNRKGNMMQHQKRHGKEGVFTCRMCGETFSSIGLVLRHRRTHGEEEAAAAGTMGINGAGGEDPDRDPELALAFKCDECGKFLSSKVSLTLHMRTHTGERPYSCSSCGKSFSQSTSLRVHERTHTGERPYACAECSRAFSSRAALTVHERGHTGERPYPCKECGKSFRCAAALKQHHNTHSDARPYPCEYCGKRFRRKEALEIHLRTHTGERPYGCKICFRRFAQKGDAKKHERTHEKVGRSNPPRIELLDDCSESYEGQPLSLVEIATDAERSVVADSMHPSLQLERGIVEDPYPNLPPGTIIINTQDLMTSSSEITVVAEEDLNEHILGNSIAIRYEEC